jgi:DNA invertase Pin-like site-specific DNA recombinase
MLTAFEIVNSMKKKQQKPGEEELRKLPDRKALVKGRLSDFSQVRDSKESVREIAAQVEKAKEDGYKTLLNRDTVEAWLRRIQTKEEPPGVLQDGEVIVNCLGLGVSGALPEDKRPDVQFDMNLLRKNELGAIYVTEGANRLARDPDLLVSDTLLKLMKETNCKLRTPTEILSPCIDRDWKIIHDDFLRGAEELKILIKRLCHRRELKAARGEYVGEPIPPGFTVPIVEIRSNGSRVYGKYQRYAPHAEIDEIVLQEFIRQGFSKMKTHRALGGTVYPIFPPDLQYMESLSSLRRARKIEGIGYCISPSMISSLARNPKLIGWAIWGDTKPKSENHEAAVQECLWLEACNGTMATVKRRGRGILHEPLEWDSLLRCCNHEISERISGHASKEAYRCQTDYVQRRGPSCFDIAARYIDKPLTDLVVHQLDFTPFAEEVLMQMEADAAFSNLEEDKQKKEIAQLERRKDNLEAKLGWEGGVHDQVLLKQIEKTQGSLEELRSRPAPKQTLSAASYQLVKDFLTGLSGRWYTYPRTQRNRLLKGIIDHVDIRHHGQVVEATVYWKTGQVQAVNIQRPRPIGNLESRWNQQDKDLLKMLWPSSSRDTIFAAFPVRTWKALAHQAYKQGWHRPSGSSKHTSRRSWEPDEEEKARQLFESGTPISDIASNIGRSYTAVLQRSWGKGWQRPHSGQRTAVAELLKTNQNPEVSKGISSGTTNGGRSILIMIHEKGNSFRNIVFLGERGTPPSPPETRTS